MRPLVMSTLLAALPTLVVLSAAGCQANKPVTMALRAPDQMGPNAKPAPGPAGEPALEVRADARAGATWLADCDKPAIVSPDYVLRGRVKYDNLTQGGYLELANDFGYKGTFFTRSLAEEGPMASLTGTSDWRAFELPFHADPGMIPQRLVLGVAISGAGTVTVAEPLVVTSLNFMIPWWTGLQGVFVAVSLAACFGILAGLIGMALFSGKSSLLIASLCGAGLAVGAAALLGGIVALAAGQPWYVSCPLIIMGAIGVSGWGLALRRIVGRSQVEELRRMTAADVV